MLFKDHMQITRCHSHGPRHQGWCTGGVPEGQQGCRGMRGSRPWPTMALLTVPPASWVLSSVSREAGPVPRVERERPPESGSTGPLGRLCRLTCTRGAGAAGWALRTTVRPAGTGSGPRASEMRRGLVFRTRQSSHKKSKEISACGNFSAQMRINELAFFSPGVNKHEQFGAAAVGAWAFSFIKCPVLHTAFGRAGPGQQALGEC